VDIDMAEIRGQMSKPTLHIKPLFVPDSQSRDDKRMPQRVEGGPFPALMRLYPNPLGDLSEALLE
jgi:hypothetical protein